MHSPRSKDGIKVLRETVEILCAPGFKTPKVKIEARPGEDYCPIVSVMCLIESSKQTFSLIIKHVSKIPNDLRRKLSCAVACRA